MEHDGTRELFLNWFLSHSFPSHRFESAFTQRTAGPLLAFCFEPRDSVSTKLHGITLTYPAVRQYIC